MIKPLADRVVVKPIEETQKKLRGLVIPDATKEKPQQGKVVAVGSDVKDDSGKGYVYILTNPSFKEDWVKIGMSSREVDVRSNELDNTAVPLPFEIYATLKTAKFSEVEKILHKIFTDLADARIRKGREFFNVSPEKALDYLKDQARILSDAEVNSPEEEAI
ncbi:MAG: GIY-YIG nuclease family protein, partial [Candidatus Peribacteria bacterium]|nr:GIY-YIG nuclease family protein [Candidatus Peribacteria bacterium]